MSFRTRQRFLRIEPPPKPVVVPEPIPEPALEPEPEPERAPLRLLQAPITDVHFASLLPSRDECVVCCSQRDELGRLPIGRCSPECPVVA